MDYFICHHYFLCISVSLFIVYLEPDVVLLLQHQGRGCDELEEVPVFHFPSKPPAMPCTDTASAEAVGGHFIDVFP